MSVKWADPSVSPSDSTTLGTEQVLKVQTVLDSQGVTLNK